MRAVLLTHPTGEQFPMILDDEGLPIVSASEYLLSRHTLASNTRMRNARELMALYRWVQKYRIDLDAMFEGRERPSMTMFTTSLVNGLQRKYRNVVSAGVVELKSYKDSQKAVSTNTYRSRLLTVRSFFSDQFDQSLDERRNDPIAWKKVNEIRDTVIGWLDKQMRSGASNKRKDAALTEKEAEKLLEVVLDQDEVFSRSRFVRFRNYISVSIMLCFGLRPGELLSLRDADLILSSSSQLNVFRRPPDPLDTRLPRPAIKRSGRPLAIYDYRLARHLAEYVKMRSEVLEANKECHEYLIISQDGKPLSHSMITKLFQVVRTRYKSIFRSDLNASCLRHSFSTNMENEMRALGVEEERRRKLLAFARGDSSLSSQDAYLDAAFLKDFEEASRRHQGIFRGGN
ncbi:tyrosine-type recombinase/integrase [Pseudomonas sp. NPDC099000]|uniref:tyrosine-type recombinase/integrase n=1 Tax=Pseudomonas sp. NPDC099000 TaxID=3364488 RepID=UPI00383B22F5